MFQAAAHAPSVRFDPATPCLRPQTCQPSALRGIPSQANSHQYYCLPLLLSFRHPSTRYSLLDGTLGIKRNGIRSIAKTRETPGPCQKLTNCPHSRRVPSRQKPAEQIGRFCSPGKMAFAITQMQTAQKHTQQMALLRTFYLFFALFSTCGLFTLALFN